MLALEDEKKFLLSQKLLNGLWGQLAITCLAYQAVEKYSFQLQMVWLFWYLIQSRVLWKVIKSNAAVSRNQNSLTQSDLHGTDATTHTPQQDTQLERPPKVDGKQNKGLPLK